MYVDSYTYVCGYTYIIISQPHKTPNSYKNLQNLISHPVYKMRFTTTTGPSKTLGIWQERPRSLHNDPGSFTQRSPEVWVNDFEHSPLPPRALARARERCIRYCKLESPLAARGDAAKRPRESATIILTSAAITVDPCGYYRIWLSRDINCPSPDSRRARFTSRGRKVASCGLAEGTRARAPNRRKTRLPQIMPESCNSGIHIYFCESRMNNGRCC